MKRILAIILTACMLFALAACSGNDNTNQKTSDSPSQSPENSTSVSPAPSTPSSSSSPVVPPSEDELGTDPLDKVGFYDPDYDYNANKRYKVAYVTLGLSVFHADFDLAFQHWASVSNVEYTGVYSVADNDAFLNQIRAFKDQGYDGLLFDPDMMLYPAIADRCKEVDIEWMGCLGQASTFENGKSTGLLHPYIGHNHYQFGIECTKKVVEYKEQNWPDVDMADVGYLVVDMTTSPPIHERVVAAQATWNEMFPDLPNNIFIVDTSSGSMNIDTANNLATAVLTSNPQFEYWISFATIDDFAQGVAMALENLGMENNGVVSTVGGTSLRAQWDAGQQTAWKYAYNTPNTIYGEPIFFALYAYMSGQATPETIWPSWKNKSSQYGAEYAQLSLPSYWMEYETYRLLFGWADVYAGSSTYGYDTAGISRDLYSTRLAIPEEYKG